MAGGGRKSLTQTRLQELALLFFFLIIIFPSVNLNAF